ncbi:hypothetical protein SD10_08335 [Spirosoma radiotolerans]|uniref:Uncharacterized protein n=1 Tax=Spirosoma radiotolerans TaxID=1379870 RepID=A0A0E3V6X2_9BACT|nr:hypothetical protein SD10_08335 [Spirosoma radiotolerans]
MKASASHLGALNEIMQLIVMELRFISKRKHLLFFQTIPMQRSLASYRSGTVKSCNFTDPQMYRLE